MKFCKNCGEQIKEDALFCNHCGAKVEASEQDPTEHRKQTVDKTKDTNENTDRIKEDKSLPTESSENSLNHSEIGTGGPPTEPKKMSSKTKKTIMIAAFIILVLIIAFKVGDSIYAPNKTAKKFNDAVQDSDAKALKELIVSEDDELKIDNKSVESMLDHLEDNEDTKEILINHIDEQGERLQKNGSEPSIFEDDIAFNLKKNGTFLMYDKYEVVVSPIYFELSTNYKDTELLVNEESVGKSKKEYYTKKVGPYLPGTYDFKAKYESEFVDLEAEKTVENFTEDNVPVVDLSISGQSVTFDLPFYDELDKVDLYINGKDTKSDLTKDATIKPMKTGKNIKAAYEATFPWGDMRSSEFYVNSTYPRAAFQVDEDLQKKLKKRIIKSEKEQFEALTTGGKKLPTNMDKKEVEELEKRAKKDKEDDVTYAFEYLGSDFDETSYVLNYRGDKWVIEVKTTSHRKEQIQKKSDKAKTKLVENEKTKKYLFEYDEKEEKWIIKKYDNYGSPDSDSIDEYREEKPKTFKTK